MCSEIQGMAGSMDSTNVTNYENQPIDSSDPTLIFTECSFTTTVDGRSTAIYRGKSQNGAAVKNYYESRGKAATCTQPASLSRGNSATGTEVGLFSLSLPSASVSTQEALDTIGIWPNSQQPLPDISASQLDELCFGRLDDKEFDPYSLPPSMTRELSAFRTQSEGPMWCPTQSRGLAAPGGDDVSLIFTNVGYKSDDDINEILRGLLDGTDSGMEESGSSTDTAEEFSSNPSSSFGLTDGRELPEDHAGDYGFDIELPNLKGEFCLDGTGPVRTLYLRAKPFSVTFSFERKPKVGTYVKVRAAFTNQGRVGMPVDKCKKSDCPSKKDPQGWMQGDAPYIQLLKQDGSAPSEETEIRFPSCKAVTAHFGICCYNSCYGAKTEIRLIFEARNSHNKIIGVRSLDVRVCAAPKRDYGDHQSKGSTKKEHKKDKLKRRRESADGETHSEDGQDSGNTYSSADEIPKMKRMKTEEHVKFSQTGGLIDAGFLNVSEPGVKAKARLENGKICIGIELCLDDDRASILHARHLINSAIFTQKFGNVFKLGVPMHLSETPQNVPEGLWAISSKGSGPSQAPNRPTQQPAQSQGIKAEGVVQLERFLTTCGLKISPSIFIDAGVHTMAQLKKLGKPRIAEILSFCNEETVKEVWKQLKK